MCCVSDSVYHISQMSCAQQVTFRLPGHCHQGARWHESEDTKCHTQFCCGRLRAQASLIMMRYVCSAYALLMTCAHDYGSLISGSMSRKQLIIMMRQHRIQFHAEFSLLVRLLRCII